ncbi:TIGR03808 family TAT-translocated repetitive protein [soil metagenome]
MEISRRVFVSSAAVVSSLAAATAGQSAIKPDGKRDQSAALQAAIDAAAGGALHLPAGIYRAGGLRITRPLHLSGVRGATKIIGTGALPLLSVQDATHVTVAGLGFDGGDATGDGEGLIIAARADALVVEDCDIGNSAVSGIVLRECSGRVSNNAVSNVASTGIFAFDSKGLEIAGNRVSDIGNNAIQVWTSERREDGTLVHGNRIERVAAKDGGSGQNGNGITVFRAGNVTVSNNRISDCVYSAVRDNSGSNCQIIGNSCSRLGETALYVEFAYEGAIVSNNIVEDASLGISITNFNDGGRLVVVANNILRRMLGPVADPERRAIGIAAEADTLITGNIIEDAPYAGISLGWGPMTRNLTALGNLIRNCGMGISVSVSDGIEGPYLIANNRIAGSAQGAIVGMNYLDVATGDLTKTGAVVPRHISLQGNVVA